MKRAGLLTLVLILSASGAYARIAGNRIALNGVSLNSGSSDAVTPVIVQTVTLANGTVLTVEPAH